jgi:hypothetical protein
MICSVAKRVANTIYNSGWNVHPDPDFNFAKAAEKVGLNEAIRQLRTDARPLDLRGRSIQEIQAHLISRGGVANVIGADYFITMNQHQKWLAQNRPDIHRNIQRQHGNIYSKFGIEVEWGQGTNIGIIRNDPNAPLGINEGIRQKGEFMHDLILEFHQSGQCGCCQPNSWMQDPIGGGWRKRHP